MQLMNRDPCKGIKKKQRKENNYTFRSVYEKSSQDWSYVTLDLFDLLMYSCSLSRTLRGQRSFENSQFCTLSHYHVLSVICVCWEALIKKRAINRLHQGPRGGIGLGLLMGLSILCSARTHKLSPSIIIQSTKELLLNYRPNPIFNMGSFLLCARLSPCV